MVDFGFGIFPSGVLGGDGRRIRPGSLVRVLHQGTSLVGEVTGWAGRLGVEVTFNDDPYLLIVPPVELERVDEFADDPLMAGVMLVDDDPRPTSVVIPIGGRDVQLRSGLGELTGIAAELASGAPSSDPGSGRDLRAWSSRCREVLEQVGNEDRARVVWETFDMPMLRRTLDEAMLPEDLDLVVPVVTDQVEPQPTDTVEIPFLIDLWMRGRGHVGEDDPFVRPVGRLTEPIRVSRLPFQLDAVVHQVGAQLGVLDGVERASVVLAGGTPAMMYGTLIAVGARLGSENTTSVQVPQDWVVRGVPVVQPLVEMSLSDAAFQVREETGHD